MACKKLANSPERIFKIEFPCLLDPIQKKFDDACPPCGIGIVNPVHRLQPRKEDEKIVKFTFSNNTENSKNRQSNLQSDIALVELIQDCTRRRDLFSGSALLARINEPEVHKRNIFIGSALVTMYSKCGALTKAQEIFDELPSWDVVSWTALITGYANYGHNEEAFECFERMQCEGLFPDALTYACILKACGCMGAAERGRKLHAEILKKGIHGSNMVLSTAIVDMYAKCGALQKAYLVFDDLLIQDFISWTALISGYCQHGHSKEALCFFEKMKHSNVLPGAVTFASILQACGNMKAANTGRDIHTDIVKRDLVENDSVLGVALVDMYAKCGAFAEAEKVSKELGTHDAALLNALVAGYCQHGFEARALTCFEMMRHRIQPDAVTFACILKACGSLGAIEKGKEIHIEIVRGGWLEKLNVLGSALVDMYSKCGALGIAQEAFDKLPLQDIFSWTALITGYCQHGYGEQALSNFDRMIHMGQTPDAIAFISILSTCSRLAAIGKGERYFERMGSHGILPTQEHCTCMVGLFGRRGNLNKAISFITEMPFSNYPPAWYSLMSACRWWGNAQIGLFAFECALQFDVKSAKMDVSK